MTYDKINGGIAFRESDHVYFNVNNPDIKYISVTTLIEKFGKPFDKEFWSQYKALEKVLDPDYFKLEKKRLLDTKKFNKDYYLKTYNIDEVKFNSAQQDILDAWQQENQKSNGEFQVELQEYQILKEESAKEAFNLKKIIDNEKIFNLIQALLKLNILFLRLSLP